MKNSYDIKSTMDTMDKLSKQDSTFVQTYDFARWYYKRVKKNKSASIHEVLSYLINLENMNANNNYKGFFKANTIYISNRLLLNRHSVSDALNTLVDDGFIFRYDISGIATYIKLNQPRILQIEKEYTHSDDYKKWHRNIIDIWEEEENSIVAPSSYTADSYTELPF